ncbi:MAG TPA: alpha-2-macroglobulin family protein, partial [Puia sp.]|nr:alpha-2-macroglobulin family protein [Puia sp.]
VGQDRSGQQDRRGGNEEDKEKYEMENGHVYFFTDRSIYRPGQTVYFKGIVVTQDFDTRLPKILAGREAKVVLYNSNNENLDSLKLVTDEYGAYHGTFHLPEHQLNGNFSIADLSPYSKHYFYVEEYKRPGFSVAFDRAKGSYRVGDSIRVTGKVQAYAGNGLDGASVKYRIIREASFSRFRFFGYRMRPQNSQEIAHGEIKTDANGVFRLVFAALPDRNIAAASNPRFHYRVAADVTDINGETRSGTDDIVAGYTALDLSIWVSGERPFTPDKLKYLEVIAVNLSGESVPSKVRVAAYPLRSPNRLIRERQWTAPELSVMSESAFLDSFPHDQYREELKKENWPRGPMAWEATDSTGDRQIPLRLSPGWWVLEATVIDAFGQVVKDEQYVELQDETQRPVSPQYLWGNGTQAETFATPGGKAVVETGTSAADVFVFRKIERPDDSWPALRRKAPGRSVADSAGEYSSFVLTNAKNSSEWTVMEADRGGFGVSDAFVKDNRLYMHQSLVKVPWTNKQLQIRYTTYRDKTEPGSGEKWAVTIGGDKGTQASAQVLTAMYDASLDQFHPQSWSSPSLFPELEQAWGWEGVENFQNSWSREWMRLGGELPVYDKRYDQLLWIGGPIISSDMYVHGARLRGVPLENPVMDFKGNVTAQGQRRTDVRVNGKQFNAVEYDHVVVSDTVDYKMKIPGVADEEQMGGSAAAVRIRKNFNETAFFFPDLRTDSAGNVSFSFTMPEALTQWKWMTLAHTRDLAFGYSEKTIVTQKQLMVQPNIPRFLREGDKINLSVKVVNLTDSEMTGQMGLALTDPTTGETADGWFVNRQPNQYFTVAAHGSAVVEFPLDIPFQYNRPLSYRIVAQAGNYSDGEEATLPVVSNRMLVTETLPLNMPGDGTRSFRFDKLLQSGSSETLSHHSLTVEFTANPAWYAVQALPYLMEFPYECAEQVFDRLYANALASKIVNSSPRIAQVFARWRMADTAALLSNLEKNPELKSVLLEETPWVLQGKTESQQKKNIALLFDMTRMSGELESAMGRLKELQAPDGGFAWFKGGPDDRFVTQFILTGIGHLQQLRALPAALAEKVKGMVTAALPFVDQQIRMDYERELKMEKSIHRISELAVQYLYMRSMFNDYGIPGDIFPAVFYYRKLARQEWVTESKYMQGMIALALFRTGDQQTGRNIIASLRQTAIHSEELGMYWKGMEGGYYWYQAPIETESLLIEAFREISGDAGVDRELKTWLLRQKQTHSWATTKATADAVYALLLGGQDWLTAERSIGIRLGDKLVDWGFAGASAGEAGEAGTGYYKKIFDAPFINPSMGDVTVTMRTRGKTGSRPEGSPAWGAVYWQYFDQLDRITPTGGGAALRLAKRVFVQRNTDRGPLLDTIPDGGSLKVGDRVVVRIELRADRDLEYVHLKDMRAACLEPVNVLSGYKWQGGLGYYETTKDASTEFFFPEVGKGTYVFEYALVAGQTGEFSNGISSVECMYAPEFAFHTEGIRINVEGGQ